MSVLTFNEKDHAYFIDGQPVISVTQALEAVGKWPDFSEIPVQDRQHYLDRGRHVHGAIHYIIRYIKARQIDGEFDVEAIDAVILDYIADLDPEIAGFVRSFNTFRQDPTVGLTIVTSEERVYSDFLNVAGTLDLWAAMRFLSGVGPFLGDFKCGVHKYQYGYQSAGYVLLKFGDVYRPRRFGIHLDKKGGFPDLVEHTNHMDYDNFQWAIRKYYQHKTF